MSLLHPPPRFLDAPEARAFLAWPDGPLGSEAGLVDTAHRLQSLALRWGHLSLAGGARRVDLVATHSDPSTNGAEVAAAIHRTQDLLRSLPPSVPRVAHLGTHPLPPLPGISVERVETSDALFGLLAREQVGLLVLEVALPTEDGRSVLARLREDPLRGDLPVLAVEYVGDAAVPDLLMLGVGDVLVEPVSPDALAEAIRSRHPVTTASLPQVRPRRPPRLLGRSEFRARLAEQGGGPLHLGRISLDRFTSLLERLGTGAMLDLLEGLAGRVEALTPGIVVSPWETGGFHLLLLGSETAALERLRTLRTALSAEPLLGTPLSLSGTVEPLPMSGGSDALDRAIQEARQRIFEVRMAGGGRVVPPGDPTASPDHRPPLRLLVVDDDEITTAIVRHRFEREGFEVEAVPDGVDALDRLRGGADQGSGIPDLVVLDWHLPGMDGIQVLEGMREDPATARLPVIMLTGRSREADLARAFSAGVDDYLLKPFSPVELVARSRRLLSWSDRARTPGR